MVGLLFYRLYTFNGINRQKVPPRRPHAPLYETTVAHNYKPSFGSQTRYLRIRQTPLPLRIVLKYLPRPSLFPAIHIPSFIRLLPLAHENTISNPPRPPQPLPNIWSDWHRLPL